MDQTPRQRIVEPDLRAVTQPGRAGPALVKSPRTGNHPRRDARSLGHRDRRGLPRGVAGAGQVPARPGAGTVAAGRGAEHAGGCAGRAQDRGRCDCGQCVEDCAGQGRGYAVVEAVVCAGQRVGPENRERGAMSGFLFDGAVVPQELVEYEPRY